MKIETVVPEPNPADATEYMVRMRDSIRLATDVYLPYLSSPASAIVVRLPYDKRSTYVYFTQAAKKFTERGYALVVQDVRGKFRSEGETVAFLNETNDGFDTLEWVANQAWCNGKIGMFGDSYYGFTQWAAVASEHPALRAIVPRVTSASIGHRGVRFNSDSRTQRVPTLWQPKYLAENWSGPDSYTPEWEHNPQTDKQMFEDFFTQIGLRSSYFDITHQLQIPMRIFPGRHPFDAKPLPVLHVAGWFDNLKMVSFHDYLHLSSLPGWDALQYLWVDSMDHEGYRLPHAPIQPHDDHIVSPAALDRHLDRYVNPALDFFDVFLDQKSPASSLPRVSWHLSNGEDRMQKATAWPPCPTEPQHYTLRSAKQSKDAAPGGLLDASGSHGESNVVWVHDPRNPVPAHTANMYAILAEYPDEATTGDRGDVLVFTSAPMIANTDFIGDASLTLTISASAPSTDVIVKLLDVSPDGTAHIVAWGDAQLVEQDTPQTFTVDLGHIAYRYRSGHAIRLHIAGSEYPTYYVNPGTGQRAYGADSFSTVEMTLHCHAATVLHLPKATGIST